MMVAWGCNAVLHCGGLRGAWGLLFGLGFCFVVVLSGFVSLWFWVADWVWVDLGWFGLVVGLIFGFGFLAGNVGFVAGAIYMLGGFLWTCVLSGFVTWLEFWLVCCVWLMCLGWVSLGVVSVW